MLFLTDFADQAVVLPVALVVLVILLILGWRRGAVAWICGVGGVLSTMLVLKLIVFACAWQLSWTGISSPSGHTAAAAVVYGGLLALLAPRARRGALLSAILGGTLALLVGLTRLAMHVHTVPDVMVGAVVGVAGAVLLRRFAGERPAGLSSPRLALAVCIAIALFHGHRLAAETRIRWLALDVWPLSLCRVTMPATSMVRRISSHSTNRNDKDGGFGGTGTAPHSSCLLKPHLTKCVALEYI